MDTGWPRAIGSPAWYITTVTSFLTDINESLGCDALGCSEVERGEFRHRFTSLMKIRSLFLRLASLVVTLITAVVHAAAPRAAPGLWQITVVDFADRTSVMKECVKTPDWSWWIIYAGNTAGDESCRPPVAKVDGDIVTITQECKSVTAELLISEAGGGKIAGKLITSSLTPYGQAIPFQSEFEAQRLSTDCP